MIDLQLTKDSILNASPGVPENGYYILALLFTSMSFQLFNCPEPHFSYL